MIFENDLNEALKMVKGKGKYQKLGPKIVTCEGQRIHQICLELENRKLIKRVREAEDFIVWEAKEGGAK